MFDKYIYVAVIIFVFLVSFLASVGSPDMIVQLFRNLFSFVVMTAVLSVVLITFPMLFKKQQNNDFLYY